MTREDAVISDSMRDAVRGLTERATVCVVSGQTTAAAFVLWPIGEVQQFLNELAR
jgi:hypothetical protein